MNTISLERSVSIFNYTFLFELESFNNLHLFLTRNMAIFKNLFIFPLNWKDSFLVDSSLLMFIFANGKESFIVLMQTCWQMADMTWLKLWKMIPSVPFHSPFDMYQNCWWLISESDLFQILINLICPICCCYYEWSNCVP